MPGGARTTGNIVASVYAAGDARNGSSLVVSSMTDSFARVNEVAEGLGL